MTTSAPEPAKAPTVWDRIGKPLGLIAAVVAIVGGVVAITAQGCVDVEVKADAYPYSVSPLLAAQIDELLALPGSIDPKHRLYTRLESRKRGESEFDLFSMTPVVRQAGEIAMRMTEPRMYGSAGTVTITNEGSGGVSDVALELPTRGEYKLEIPGAETKKGTFKDAIQIGNLRSGSKAVVGWWAISSEWTVMNSTVVTFKEGSRKVVYPAPANGWIGFLVRYHLLELPLLLIELPALLAAVWLSVRLVRDVRASGVRRP